MSQVMAVPARDLRYLGKSRSGQEWTGEDRRRCTMGFSGPCYFVIEKEKVFEIDLMPEGAEGLKVTKAV